MSKSFAYAAFAVAAMLAGSASAQAATGDAAKGATLFKQRCGMCHQTVAGKNGVGPSLAKVVGRKAGTAPGFNYTPAIKASGLTWKKPVLDTFLTAPGKVVNGTAMPIATPNAQDRADIIAYLATQ
jgi:cytochrome c